MRTSLILSITAALAAVVVASSDDASARSRGGGDNRPSVRDHRAPREVNIRDHRAPTEVKIRDHRAPKSATPERPGFVWVAKKGQPGHWERPRAEAKSVPVVRDHRVPPRERDSRPAKTVEIRDHRTGAASVVRDHRGTVRYVERKGAPTRKATVPRTPMPLNVPTGR